MIAASASLVSSVVSNVFVALAALLAVFGGIIGVLNYRGKAAVRQQRQDDAAAIVFGKDDEPNLRQLLEANTRDLAVVTANMLPNGGKSLRDDIAATRRDQHAMNDTLQRLVGKVDMLNGQTPK
jgi:hypothetical protein